MQYLVAGAGIQSSDQTLDEANGSPTKSTMAQKMPSEGRIGVVVMPCLHRLKTRTCIKHEHAIISVTVPSAHIPAVLHACNIWVSHQLRFFLIIYCGNVTCNSYCSCTFKIH